MTGADSNGVVPAPSSQAPVLSVRDLRVAYAGDRGAVPVVHGVDFDLFPGESLGIVGESGSGKSTVILAAARLLPSNATITAGSVRLDGTELVSAGPRALRRIHGPRLGMLYQDSLRALNPVMKIGAQIIEVLDAHDAPGDHDSIMVELLKSVGINDPLRRASQYPHQLSGGMRQRVMTAMALALSPSVLFADEPTTALDVTIQAQILDMLRERAVESGSATVIVSHDLGVIANLCERVLVMYAGRIVESGETEAIFADPQHPYTASLLSSVPRIDRGLRRLPYIPGRPPDPNALPSGCSFAPRCPVAIDACEVSVPPLRGTAMNGQTACLRDDVTRSVAVALIDEAEREADEHVPTAHGAADEDPLLVVRGLTRHFKLGKGRRAPVLRAVDGVDFEVRRGEFLGLVGESGCGKSTLGRMLVGLEPSDDGDILLDGRGIATGHRKADRQRRRVAQMVFQDPRSSLNRRMTVGQHLDEALNNAGVERSMRAKRMAELLDQVGLPGDCLARLPNEFSGGQAQRIAIARALAVSPQLLVADEAVSSLDVSVKGQIVNLLRDLQADLGLTVLFISHDLGVVRQVSDRVAVMYLGRLCEVRETTELFESPRHPYTKALLSAIPVPDPVVERQQRRIILSGDVPNPTDPPSGCRFHPRCPVGPEANPERDVCRTQEPEFDHDGSATACHFAGQPLSEQMVTLR
ncbi:MAG: dipeptide ABC transporter ATP-binding protein [Ilumatobacter sp.]|uniref:dipeptide ABC transporter ATP-binding protein n=1 Tax=Ilumatobacter sp. TaxID=1967498 RepID=UPI00391BB3D2